jgi:hypothetical protein
VQYTELRLLRWDESDGGFWEDIPGADLHLSDYDAATRKAADYHIRTGQRVAVFSSLPGILWDSDEDLPIHPSPKA